MRNFLVTHACVHVRMYTWNVCVCVYTSMYLYTHAYTLYISVDICVCRYACAHVRTQYLHNYACAQIERPTNGHMDRRIDGFARRSKHPWPKLSVHRVSILQTPVELETLG